MNSAMMPNLTFLFQIGSIKRNVIQLSINKTIPGFYSKLVRLKETKRPLTNIREKVSIPNWFD